MGAIYYLATVYILVDPRIRFGARKNLVLGHLDVSLHHRINFSQRCWKILLDIDVDIFSICVIFLEI